MNHVKTVILISLSISVVFFHHNLAASEYFSWLSVEYKNGAVKTFLQGPIKTKKFCNELNKITWNGAYTACGSCRKTEYYCADLNTLPEGLKKILRGEKSFTPYVIATNNSRIFFSGVKTADAIAECKRLAKVFRENANKSSRCVQP